MSPRRSARWGRVGKLALRTWATCALLGVVVLFGAVLLKRSLRDGPMPADQQLAEMEAPASDAVQPQPAAGDVRTEPDFEALEGPGFKPDLDGVKAWFPAERERLAKTFPIVPGMTAQEVERVVKQYDPEAKSAAGSEAGASAQSLRISPQGESLKNGSGYKWLLAFDPSSFMGYFVNVSFEAGRVSNVWVMPTTLDRNISDVFCRLSGTGPRRGPWAKPRTPEGDGKSNRVR